MFAAEQHGFRGVGAALPLLIIGLLSREALQRWRKRALSVSHAIKTALGVQAPGDRAR